MVAKLIGVLADATPTGESTVPAALVGCWRRNWIQFGPDGELERQVRVIWLQTASGMADVRIDPAQAPHETDSSCGITVVDQSTTPFATADWLDGSRGFAQQPVSNFPEKGWLDWQTPSLMRELAPSGAYIEEWERFDDSVGPTAQLSDLSATTRTNLYVAGSHVVLCSENPDAGGLHEFSWGRHSPGAESVTIDVSTVAARVGQPLGLDRPWSIESYCEM